MASILFRKMQVWTAEGILKDVSLRVQNSMLVQMTRESLEALPEEEIVEGSADKVLMPAGVDLQVHLRVPGQSQKETAESGLRAARKGAYAAVLTMPNTKPVIDNTEVLNKAKFETLNYEKELGVKVLWSVAMTLGQQGQEITDSVELKRAGAVALTDDGVGVASDKVMRNVFEEAARSGLPVLQHAEVPGHGGVLAEGSTQASLGLKAYPADAEWKMVERDIGLLREFPEVPYHVLHVSSAKTVELISKARQEGLKVTGEATPHHLFFSSEDVPVNNTSFKMNPPLRGGEDRQVLRAALASGTLAFVSTDHAPHEASLKGEDFEASAYGTTGLETSLRVLLELYNEGVLSPERLVQVFASAPADFIGIAHEGYGRFIEGMRFRGVLIDPKAAAQPIGPEDLESLSKNNIFLGTPLRGRILKRYF